MPVCMYWLAAHCGPSCRQYSVWRTERGTRGQIHNTTPIAARPAGGAPHSSRRWEGDPKGGHNASTVWTLVKQTTRLVILTRMDGTDATSAREGFTKKLQHVRVLLRITLLIRLFSLIVRHAHLA